MDIPPPWYTPTARICSGETRGCSGGDAACHQQAARDGFVAISTYSFCRREEIHTVPTPEGAGLLFAFLVLISIVLWRVRRARSR